MKTCDEIMLEIGTSGKLSVRTESFAPFKSNLETAILYVSDLHLKGHSERLIAQLHHIIRETHPRLMLLGGDIVDHRGGVREIAACIAPILEICPVWAVPGNHEDYAGRQSVRQHVESAGGQWLEKRSMILSLDSTRKIRIDGTLCPQRDPSAFSILCAHYPAVFPKAITYGYDLVLAGHLHGSQIVFAEFRGRLYPGALFFRWNGDKFVQGKTTMVVSRGANDTYPIRWNCPREVILCQIS
jgi:uncharacterized protein